MMAKRSVLAITLLASCGGRAPLQPLPDGGPPDVARFAAIGDYGSGSADEGAVADLIRNWGADYIVTLGDNNYPSGEAATIDDNIGRFYADYIGGYHGRFGPGSPVNRFWPCIGNHDRYSMPPLQPYLDYFHALPNNGRYYDVVIGDVQLFALDSNDPRDPALEPDGFTMDSVQGRWLQSRLALSKACHKIVFFHHPPYSSGTFGVSQMQWPFKAWGADVVMTGHEHFYERLDVDGIPYITQGLGGDDKFGFNDTPDARSRVRYNQDFGALLITADKHGIHYEFRTVSGVTVDTLTVPKSCL